MNCLLFSDGTHIMICVYVIFQIYNLRLKVSFYVLPMGEPEQHLYVPGQVNYRYLIL